MTASILESEGYIPGTDVRVNLLGITDARVLERAITTELPAEPAGIGTLTADLRYERHWDMLGYRSHALRENAEDRHEVTKPLTTPTLAPEEPTWIDHDEELALELAHEQYQREVTSMLDEIDAEQRSTPAADRDAPEPDQQEQHIDTERQPQHTEPVADREAPWPDSSPWRIDDESHRPPEPHHRPTSPTAGHRQHTITSRLPRIGTSAPSSRSRPAAHPRRRTPESRNGRNSEKYRIIAAR